jgi:hypothetical protein
MQQSFSALWDFDTELRTGQLTLQEANKKCLQLRNAKAKELRQQGAQVSCFTLQDQCREYWGLGDPCGLSCPAYYLMVH